METIILWVRLYWSHFKEKLRTGEALGEIVLQVLQKFSAAICINMHVRVPMLKHSVRSSSRDNSAFMRGYDYLNIPTVPEGLC